MQYKSYGKTGKNISVISCGGMRFENPDDIDANAEPNWEQIGLDWVIHSVDPDKKVPEMATASQKSPT